MKKIIGWLLVVTLTAIMAVGGTVAFLSDTDEDVNVMTVGNVKIDQLEYERVDVESKDDQAEIQEFENFKPLYPAVTEDGFDWIADPDDAYVDWNQIGKDSSDGIWDPDKISNEQDKMVFVKNKGTFDAYVRSVFAFEAGSFSWDEFQELFHLNLNDTDYTWEWIQTPVTIGDTNFFLATATYNHVLPGGQFTEPSLLQIALDGKAENDDILSLGEKYDILVASQAMQAEGFENPQTALVEGFYQVTTEKHPFKDEILPMYIYSEYDLITFSERGGLGILMDDFEVTSRVYFSTSDYVLDMNGHTITNSNLSISKTGFVIRVDSGATMVIKGNGSFVDNHVDRDYYYSVGIFCISGNGSVLTLEDGYYNVGMDDESNMFFQAQSGGKIILHDIVVENNGTGDSSDMLYAISEGTVEIYGGFYRKSSSYHSLMNVRDGRPGKFIIYGGTFVNHYPGKTNDPWRIKVADGYTVVSEEQANGEIWYTVVPVS